MEYEILKRSIKLTIENLRKDTQKQNFDDTKIAKLFSILDCSIDQHEKLFELARADGEIQIMKNLIEDSFRRERSMNQKLAKEIYMVTRPKGLQIVYDMFRRDIEEELKLLQYDYEDLVRNCSVNDLVDDPDYNYVLKLFDDHQKAQRVHDELFEEAVKNNDKDGMNQSIASDFSIELKIVQKIREAISNLQQK